ncbi:MAG: cytochrome c3 family protein [Planctomycetota bacterium]|jgi:predicted CXXCH cytochrome family protein
MPRGRLRPALLAVLPAFLVAACGDREGSSRPRRATDTAATAAEVAASFHRPDPDRIPPGFATNPGTPWGSFVGSRACEQCHPTLYAQWRNSFHSRTLYDAVTETIFGDFSGDMIFDDPAFPFIVRPHRKTDPETGRVRHYMHIRWRLPEEGGPVDRREADTYGRGFPAFEDVDYEIFYAFGSRLHQPYVARWPDGKHWVVPVFWNDVVEEWRYDGFRPYVEACASCHVTGIKTQAGSGYARLGMTFPPHFTPPPDQEGWADGAVGCEVCHGAGREHIAAVERVGVQRYRRLRENDEKPPTIFDGRSATLEHLTNQCDQCHNFFTESTVTWSPTPEGFRRDPEVEPITPHNREGTWQFYADGSHKSPCTVGAVYRTSKMFAQGIGCTKCHDPHGTSHWADLRLPLENNELCLSCHEEQFPDPASQAAHSRHEPDSAGNLCHECHMPRHMVFTNGVQMMSSRIPSHAFSIPTGEQNRGGPPPSCNVCHTDRDAAWTREILAAWRAERAKPAEAD